MRPASFRPSILLLWTTVLLLVPLMIFPAKLGTVLMTPPTKGGDWSLFYSVIALEIVFYGLVLFFLDRRRAFGKLVAGVLLCFGYRLFLGAACGLLVALVYKLSTESALIFALWSFVPALLLHVAASPFALNGLIGSGNRESRSASTPQHFGSRERESSDLPRMNEERKASRPAISSSSSSRPSGMATTSLPIYQHGGSSREESSSAHNKSALYMTPKGQGEINGFDRATRYIGEHAAVFLSVVVDNEGLALSGFSRGGAVIEDWAPFALVFFDSIAPALERTSLPGLEKVDLVLQDKRAIVAREDFYTLLVIAERQSDDILNIRINQGMEIIARYVQERYPSRTAANAEREYVSSTH